MLLAYYPSTGLTKAEKNLARWQSHLFAAQNAYLAAQNEALTLYPEWPVPRWPALPDFKIAAARRAHVEPLRLQIAHYADLIQNMKQELPGERAAAYLAHVEQLATAETRQASWLANALGGLVESLIRWFPSRVSQPTVWG